MLSRSEHDPDAALVERKIEKMFELSAEIFEVHAGGEVIRTTAEHPFYVMGQGWTKTEDLVPGQLLLGHNERTTAVDRVIETKQTQQVYNMRVADEHTYFVGRQEWGFSLWVHNVCELRVLADGTIEAFDKATKTVFKVNADDLQNLVDLKKITKADMQRALDDAAKLAPSNTGPAASKVAVPEASPAPRPGGGSVPSLQGNIPQADKWIRDGGRVIYHTDGSMTYIKNGVSIRYNSVGYPDFAKHLYKGTDGLNEVRITLSTQGSKATRYRADFDAANAAAGFKNGTPKDYIWHHHEDTGLMQLVR